MGFLYSQVCSLSVAFRACLKRTKCDKQGVMYETERRVPYLGGKKNTCE